MADEKHLGEKMSRNGDWQIIRPALLRRIEELREMLERGGADQNIDNRTRGEIAGLRWLIGEVELPLPASDSPGYAPTN
jgi:hypothetical protein